MASTTYTQPVQTLIDELGKLPGIGPKSAQRIAFHLLKLPADDANRLADAIREAKEKVRFCDICFNVAEDALCPICADDRRDGTVLCVVEESRDIVAIEKTGEFRGRYHVLLGAMSPLEGIGPDQLKIRELLTRLGPEQIEEVIVCTNPNTEGEVTAMYLARLLKPIGVRVTRIASGLPVGGDLEYADELTLGRAIEGRRSSTAEPFGTLNRGRSSSRFTRRANLSRDAAGAPSRRVGSGRTGQLDSMVPQTVCQRSQGVSEREHQQISVVAIRLRKIRIAVKRSQPWSEKRRNNYVQRWTDLTMRERRGRRPAPHRHTAPPLRARHRAASARAAASAPGGCRSSRSGGRGRSPRR